MSRRSTIPTSVVMRVIVAAIIVLHVLNLMAQSGAMAADPHDGHIRFAELFTVNSEGRVPTWYSAATLLACAGLLAVIGLSAQTAHYRRHWCALAAVFGFISMDEASSFHEEVGTHLQSTLQTTGMWTNAWMIPALVFVVVFGLAMVRFLVHLPRSTQWMFMLAGGMYVGGALGMELISSAYLAATEFNFATHTYVVMATIEELLEMAGVAVFLFALLQYMAAHDITINTFELPWRRMAIALVCLTGLLFIAGVIGQVSTHIFGHGRLLGFVRLFHLDGEGNASAWFSSMLLLAAALTCVAMALAEQLPRRPRPWWILAVTFGMFSLDEFASLHELSSDALRELWQTTGLLHYPWVLGGAAAAGLVAALCAADLRRLPPRTAQGIVLSGAIFVAGAIGMEIVGAWWNSMHGETNLAYQLIASSEELLEMTGMALFVIIVLRRLQRHGMVVQVDAARRAGQADLATNTSLSRAA